MALREHHIYYRRPAAPSIPVQQLKRSRQPGALDYEADDMSSVSYRLMHNTFTTLQSPQVRGLLQRHQMRVHDELYRGFVEQQRAVHRLQFERQKDYNALVEMKRERRRIARDLRWWAKRIEENETQLRHSKRKGRQIENRLAVQVIEYGQQEGREGDDVAGDVREGETELLPPIDPPPSTAGSSSLNCNPPLNSRTNFTPALPPINEGTTVIREMTSERTNPVLPDSVSLSAHRKHQPRTLTPDNQIQLLPLTDTSSAITTITTTSVASRDEVVLTLAATTRTETDRSQTFRTPPPFVYVDRAEPEVLVTKQAAERPPLHELLVTRHKKWRPADHFRVDPRSVLRELAATGAGSLASLVPPATLQQENRGRAETSEWPPVAQLATSSNERAAAAVPEGTPPTVSAALEQRVGEAVGRGTRADMRNDERNGSDRLRKRFTRERLREYGSGTRSRSETPLYSLLRRQRAEEAKQDAQVKSFCSRIGELLVDEEYITTGQ